MREIARQARVHQSTASYVLNSTGGSTRVSSETRERVLEVARQLGYTANRAAQEVPLGAGDIDWLRWVETLTEIDYRGWLVVERESGENRLADVAAGVRFLRRITG